MLADTRQIGHDCFNVHCRAATAGDDEVNSFWNDGPWEGRPRFNFVSCNRLGSMVY